MKEYSKNLLKEFVEEVTIEDLNHLKFTMSLEEIDEFMDEWIEEKSNAENYKKIGIIKDLSSRKKKFKINQLSICNGDISFEMEEIS